MKALRYHIYLEQPLLATILDGEPNSSVSATYVLGSLVRGMCIHTYVRNNPTEDISADPTCRRLFFDGTTRYLHAYPLTENKQRTLPTPRSLLEPKSNPDTTVYNACHSEWNVDDMRETEEEENDTLKPVSYPFCALLGESVVLYKPKRTIKVHTQRDRKAGRGKKDSGAVFQYDALEPGQMFEGIILCDNDQDVATVQKLIQRGVAWLGRSRSANYGKVRFDQIFVGANWQEVHTIAEIEEGETYSLTFLSDALLYTSEGQPVTALNDTILSEYLGVTVKIDTERTFTSASVVGGFNRTWHLPLVQSYVIAAGSVVRFTACGSLDEHKVLELEQQGIGARRTEGFGRIAFNWLAHEKKYTARKGAIASDTQAQSPLVQGSEAQRLAQQMAERLLEAKIQEHIINFVRDTVQEQNMPENSQLSRVRMMVRQALPTGDTQAVLQSIGQFRATARTAFERGRIEGQSLLDWMKTLLQQPTEVWNKLYIRDNDVPIVAGCKTECTNELARTVALQLLEAVLHAPAHQRKYKGKGKDAA